MYKNETKKKETHSKTKQRKETKIMLHCFNLVKMILTKLITLLGLTMHRRGMR